MPVPPGGGLRAKAEAGEYIGPLAGVAWLDFVPMLMSPPVFGGEG